MAIEFDKQEIEKVKAFIRSKETSQVCELKALHKQAVSYASKIIRQ